MFWGHEESSRDSFPAVDEGVLCLFVQLLQVVVFMVGGATYEEARDMTELSKQSGCRIVLGGTCFHNSRSFLADVSQIIKGHTLLSGTVPSLPGGAMVWGGGSKSPHAAAGSDCQTELVAVRTR